MDIGFGISEDLRIFFQMKFEPSTIVRVGFSETKRVSMSREFNTIKRLNYPFIKIFSSHFTERTHF